MKQPNILWICTDRQRHDTLGCYGNRFVSTPHLDALAGGGAIFEQAWCQNPICAPSRASFLTGRYPRTTRVNRNAQRIPRDEKLISRLLADAGYVCGHAGKLHLAPSSPPIADWCEPRGDDGYSVFDWSLHPPATPVSAYTAWLSEHDVEFKREPVLDSSYVTFGMPPETSNTGWIAQRGINFIKCSAPLERPWFFTLNIEDPHDPFDPPREFLEPYLERLDEIPLPHYEPGELDDKPVFQRTDRAGVWGSGRGGFAAEKMNDTDQRLIRAAYWAMIDHIDYQVGRVLDALRATGQLENTLILFMSDHGEMLGDHGFYFQGPYFYEEMCRVPLLMSWPAAVKPLRVPALVELVDIAPTLLEAAGQEPYAGMQGRSLWPILSGQADPSHHRDDVYAEYYRAIPGGHKNAGGAYITGVRNREYSLSCVHGEDAGELYDLKNDPTETRNLWFKPSASAAKIRMLKLLCDRMAQTIDPLPPTEAKY
jgi:arylsulfatase A-like enzyme